MCETENCEYNRNLYPFDEDYREDKQNRRRYDLPYEYDYRQQQQPKKLNRQLEKNGKLCFSKKPVYTCPDYAYPMDTKQTEELEFVCKPISSWEAEEWRDQLRRGPIDEQTLRSHKTDFTKQVRVPASCSRF